MTNLRFANAICLSASPFSLTGCATVESTKALPLPSISSIVASDGQGAPPISGDVDVEKPNPAPDANSEAEAKNDVPTPPAPRKVAQSGRAEVHAQASFVEALSREDKTGIAYFLPRQLVRITAKRSETTLAETVKTLGQAELALSVAKAKQTSAALAVSDTEEAIISNSGTEVILNILKPRLAEQKESLKKAQEDVEAKEKALAAAQNELVNAAKSGTDITAKKYNVFLKIELLPPTADPAHGYRLNPQHSIFRDDEHKIVISPSGLLTSTDITATDRTSDIVTELATFAGAVIQGPIPGAARKDGDESRKCSEAPSEFMAVVDLANAAQVRQLNYNLQCIGARVSPLDLHLLAVNQTFGNTGDRFGGLVYRTPIDVFFNIEKCTLASAECKPDGTGWFPTEVLSLSLPQAGPISYVRQDAGFMTKTKYSVAFKDGILTSYDANRPSELLEVARTPMRIVNGLFEGVSKVISLRTGQNNANASLSASELAQLQAQYNLLAGAIAGQKQLTDAELVLLQSKFGLQTGQVSGLTQLSTADLALLQARTNLTLAQDGSRAQISASDLATMITILRDQARRDAINKCIGEKVSNGEPVENCFKGQ